jgi:ATP-dependent DNA helicase RecG
LAKGTDKVDVLDRKDFDSGIVADIEDAMRFIERNTRTAYRIERLRRENIPEYPIKALREAITNAVMHRDWFVDGANVFVEIYTDRVEVVSPGGLPKGMTLDDLGRKSIRRNALIADLLHRIDFIEKAGTGIRRIRDDVREQGCPEPAFETNGFFTAIFRPNPRVRAAAETRQAQLAGKDGTKLALSRKQVTEQVTEQVRRMLECLANQPLGTRDAMQALGLRHRPTFLYDYLQPALNAGLVEMTQPESPKSPTQKYRLTAKGKSVNVGNKLWESKGR